MSSNATDRQMPALDSGPAHRREQLTQLWEMTPEERVSAMRRGELSFWQLYNWAARARSEVPLLNGEFEFIAVSTPEVADLAQAQTHERAPR